MGKFASDLCMGNFALSVLCKVLMDMIYSKLDFISETKLLEWETVNDLMKSSLGRLYSRLFTEVGKRSRKKPKSKSDFIKSFTTFPHPRCLVSLMKSGSKYFISINTLHNMLNAKLPIHNPNVKFSMKSWHSISFSKKETPALGTLNPQKSTRDHLAPKT